MASFDRQKWDIASLILDSNEYDDCRVRMRLIMA